MNERRSPLATMLDLVVYAPLGLALTVGEELPKLAAKGRAKVGPRVSTARVVGQFAVAEGRRRTARSTDQARPASAPSPASPPLSPRPGPTSLRPVPDIEVPPPSPSPPRPTRPAPSPVPGSGAATSAEGLAIPGYDSLSASQVVQRLAGLSAGELASVGAYEAATRGRRTVLARVSQLQSS